MKYFKKISMLLLLIPIPSLIYFEGSMLLTPRQLDLLFRSLLIGLSTAMFSTSISLLLAIKLIDLKIQVQKVAVLALIFLLPSTIHVMVWYELLLNLDGLLKTVMVLVLYYMPLATMVLWLGLRRIDQRYLQLASLYRKNGAFVILGLLRPYLLSVFSLIAILVMNDFSVPSLFQYPTYSMELHSYFSLNGEASFLVAIPLILINALLLFILLLNIKKIDIKSSIKPYIIILNQSLKILIYLPVILFIAHITIMVMQLISNFSITLLKDVFISNGAGLIYSILISFVSSFLASLYAFYLHFNEKSKYIMLVYLVIPAPLIGLSIIETFNGLDCYQFLLESSFLLILANSLRILPMLILLSSGLMMTVDQSLFYAARLYGSPLHRFKYVTLPMIKPSFILTSLVGFAFSFNEIASTLLLLPPGKDWVSLRIYSYLHYGSTERIYVLGLLVVLIYLIICLLLRRYLKKVHI